MIFFSYWRREQEHTTLARVEDSVSSSLLSFFFFGVPVLYTKVEKPAHITCRLHDSCLLMMIIMILDQFLASKWEKTEVVQGK